MFSNTSLLFIIMDITLSWCSFIYRCPYHDYLARKKQTWHTFMKHFEFRATQQKQVATQRWSGIVTVPWNDFTCTRLHLSLITIILTSIK